MAGGAEALREILSGWTAEQRQDLTWADIGKDSRVVDQSRRRNRSGARLAKLCRHAALHRVGTRGSHSPAASAGRDARTRALSVAASAVVIDSMIEWTLAPFAVMAQNSEISECSLHPNNACLYIPQASAFPELT